MCGPVLTPGPRRSPPRFHRTGRPEMRIVPVINQQKEPYILCCWSSKGEPPCNPEAGQNPPGWTETDDSEVAVGAGPVQTARRGPQVPLGHDEVLLLRALDTASVLEVFKCDICHIYRTRQAFNRGFVTEFLHAITKRVEQHPRPPYTHPPARLKVTERKGAGTLSVRVGCTWLPA